MNYIDLRAIRAIRSHLERDWFTSDNKYDLARKLNTTVSEIEAALAFVAAEQRRDDAQAEIDVAGLSI